MSTQVKDFKVAISKVLEKFRISSRFFGLVELSRLAALSFGDTEL